jgi:hypothetical protein
VRALYPELKQGPLLVLAETTIYGVFLSSSVTFMQSGFPKFFEKQYTWLGQDWGQP